MSFSELRPRVGGAPPAAVRPGARAHLSTKGLIAATVALALTAPSSAQVSTPATPRVGSPSTPAPMGPPAPPRSPSDLPTLVPLEGPLPSNLTLEQALGEAEARSPAVLAARAAVQAAEARIQQAGYRSNPELSVEVENFAGSGDLSGVRGVETTVAVNQRLDLGGRRQARVATARAELTAQQLRLAIARADLAQAVRQEFANAATARDRLLLAQANEARARELSRIASILVDAGREPPLRGLRARSAAAQAAAELSSAQAAEQASRSTLAALFGVSSPPDAVSGALLDLQPRTIDPARSLDVRLTEAERLGAEAALRQEIVARSLDPAVGLGVRHIRDIGDVALVAGLSMPLPVFDRNRGNIEAARANVRAADARRAGALALATVRVRNAITNVDAARARVDALERAAVPEAAEALRLAQLSYQAGKTPLIELLDAQNAFSSAQAALIDARLAQALATAELGRVAAQ